MSSFLSFPTSGISFLFFLVLMPFSIPWMEVDNTWICVVHYLACLCPTVGSVVYHVFMNHVGGEHVYDTLLSLDMFGVCLVNTLGKMLTRPLCTLPKKFKLRLIANEKESNANNAKCR